MSKIKLEELYDVDKNTVKKLGKLFNQLTKDNEEECMEAYTQLIEIVNQSGINSNVSMHIFENIVVILKHGFINSNMYYLVLKFLAALKIHIWTLPLMHYPEKMRYGYFESLYKLDTFATGFFEDLWNQFDDLLSQDFSEEDSDNEYVNLMMMIADWAYVRMLLLTYSYELPAIYQMWPKKRVLHTLCSKCGEDLRTVIFDGDKSEAKVFEREYNYEAEEQCWNVFNYTMHYMDNFDENILSETLQRLYGRRVCRHCKHEENVIDTYMNWWNEENNITEPENELIDWLNKRAEEEKFNDYEKRPFYYKMSLCYMHNQKTPSYIKMAQCILKNCSSNAAILEKADLQIMYAKDAVNLLESVQGDSSDEYKLQLAESYGWFGRAISEKYEEDDDIDKLETAKEYYLKAKKIFDEVLGEGNDRSKTMEKNSIIMDLNSGQNGEAADENIDSLLNQIEIEKKKENPDEDKLADYYNLVAEIYAEELEDYEKTYYYYNKHIDCIRSLYGDDSDMVADCYETLAEYYEEDEEMEKACEYYEKALEINIREMGKMYMLPPIFKSIAVEVMASVGKIDKEDKFDRSMSASDSYLNVGEIYIELNKPKKAIKALKKSLALRDWELPMATSEKAYAHLLMGDAYLLMNKKKDAKAEYEMALEDYKQTIIKNEARPDKPIFESETEECKEQIEVVEEKINALEI